MLKVIRNLLQKIINDIDAGNSNIDEDAYPAIIDALTQYTRKDEGISKYSACKYLNVSRATFDNYVREGKIPKGKHEAGFKEKFWFKKDLDDFIKNEKKKHRE